MFEFSILRFVGKTDGSAVFEILHLCKKHARVFVISMWISVSGWSWSESERDSVLDVAEDDCLSKLSM